jgi:hypothetical protein
MEKLHLQRSKVNHAVNLRLSSENFVQFGFIGNVALVELWSLAA